MAKKKEPDPTAVSSVPTLWDLIATYFPEPYNEKYLDAERVYKEVKGALLRKTFAGIRAEDHEDKNTIQALTIDIKKANPKWKAPAIYGHLKENPEARMSLRKYKQRTVENWIREAIRTIRE